MSACSRGSEPNNFTLPLISSSKALGGSMLTKEVNVCACRQSCCSKTAEDSRAISGKTAAYQSCRGSAAGCACAVGSAVPGSAARWIRTQAALRVWRPVEHRRGPPRRVLTGWGGIRRRQIGLPSAISRRAISRGTKIYRTRPTALHFEQIEARLVFTATQSQAQVGRRRFEAMSFGTKQHTERTARCGGKLQSPQPAVIGAFQPEQHGSTDSRTQSLFSGPQSFRSRIGPNHQQTPQFDPLLRQGGRIRFVRGCNPDQPRRLTAALGTALAGHQRRQKQLHFAKTGLIHQYFDERRRRPPTPRQAGIQRA